MLVLLVVLQAFQVAVLWLHDWLPLPPLNDVRAVQAADGRGRLLRTTLVQSLPFTVGLLGSLAALGGHAPGWLRAWLWISYGLLFAGELRAWWVPYLGRPEPVRAARYRALFGGTHAFLARAQRDRPQHPARGAARRHPDDADGARGVDAARLRRVGL